MAIDWTRVRVRLNAAAGRVRCEPAWRLDPAFGSRLPDCDLWLVWAGKGLMRLRHRTVALRPGICFWMRPGARYEATHDPSDRLGVTYIHFDILDRRGRPMRSDAQLPPEMFDLPDLAFTEAVSRRIVELMGAATARDAARYAATALMTALLMELDGIPQRLKESTSSARREHHQLMMRLASRISESPADAPTVAEMARQTGYSTDHFARMFQIIVGQNPQAFVIRARINRARQLLAETNLAVTHIAQAVGYESLFFFSRQFKQKMGLTPLEYRASATRST